MIRAAVTRLSFYVLLTCMEVARTWQISQNDVQNVQILSVARIQQGYAREKAQASSFSFSYSQPVATQSTVLGVLHIGNFSIHRRICRFQTQRPVQVEGPNHASRGKRIEQAQLDVQPCLVKAFNLLRRCAHFDWG